MGKSDTWCGEVCDHYGTKYHNLIFMLHYRRGTSFRLTSIYFVSSVVLEQFETVDEAIALIASAPCLENLIFWSVQCDDTTCNYALQANAPPLRRIQIDMKNPLTAAIINWFCRCYPTPSVHTLVIDEFTGFYIPTMCNFIRHLGSALENLTISCPFFESDCKCYFYLLCRFKKVYNNSLNSCS